MPPTLTRSPSRPPSPSLPPVGVAIVAVLVAGAALAAVSWLAQAALAPPTTVDLVVTNPTRHHVRVVVSSPDGDGRLPLATVEPGGEAQIPDVVDQGDEWLFSFEAQGRVGAETRVERATLAERDWRIEVPAELDARLAELGVAPAP